MFPRILALCLLLSACSTTLPPKDTYLLPNKVMLEQPKPLKTLPGNGEVTPQVLMATVVENYGICRENSVAHDALIQWVLKQSKVN
jgi:hypothetical protein